MDVKEVLRFTDNLVFAKTGKHLADLEETVLRGVWQGKTYIQIAEESGYSEGYTRDVTSKLFKVLSKLLRENVNKSNFRSTMERYQISQCSNFVNFNIVQKSNINNFYAETSHPPKTPQNSPPTQTSTEDDTEQKQRLDLRDAPSLRTFYDSLRDSFADRTSSPLTTLETWIVEQNCRLVAITGISGIGKSAIARHLIPQIQTQFDRIIWRSLSTSPPLETTLKHLIQFLSDKIDINLPANTDEQLSMLIEYLREYRCLIILDDGQKILSSGQIAGNYKPGYENYGTLFKLIGELSHNSCLILNSWEAPLDILTFTPDRSEVRFLQLNGLSEVAASAILTDSSLLDEEKWPILIKFYGSNPLYLKLTAQTIKNLFGGKVAQYLSYEPAFLSDELTPILQQHYQRLSQIEKQAIAQISNEIEPVSLTQLIAKCQGSPAESFKAIQSLERRGMIEKLCCEAETFFTMPPVLKEYVKIVAG